MGIPIEFTLRLQVNMRVHPNPDIRYFWIECILMPFSQLKWWFFQHSLMTNVAENLYFPTFWFEAQGRITKDSAEVILKLFDLPQIANFVGLGVTLLCLIGIIISVFLAKKSPNRHKNVIREDSENHCDLGLLCANSASTTAARIHAEKWFIWQKCNETPSNRCHYCNQRFLSRQ